MLVFVTGGNGLIGSRVLRELAARGHGVRCLLRPGADRGRIDGLAYDAVEGDMEMRGLDGAMVGCDACVHLAGVSAWAEIAKADLDRVIVRGTNRVLDAVALAGVRRFVYVSSIAAVNGSGRPIVHDETSTFELATSGLRYAVAKHEAEQLVLRHRGGVEAVAVNPAETYGAPDPEYVTAGTVRDALTSRPALAVRGGTSVVHVDDVAAGIVSALERGRAGERYILGGDNVTIPELVRTILRLAGRPSLVAVVPGRAAELALRALAALRLPTPIDPTVVAYARRYWFVDSGKAASELGFRSRDANATLAPVVDWVQSQLGRPRGSS